MIIQNLLVYNKVIRATQKLLNENELTKHQSNLKETWSLIRDAVNS
jgi:hypothetical protein